MKNILIYTGPNKKFGKEDLKLVKIQIDNSLNLGWQRSDMILVTDFPFEYNGVKSIVLPDGLYYEFDVNANKVPVLIYLIKNNIITSNNLYWCHDLDAYENFKINEDELDLSSSDIGLTHYFYKPEWQFSSFFIKNTALDILELLDSTIKARPWNSRNNEKTLTRLIRDKKISENRYQKLNVTYNITKRYLDKVTKEAQKPLKVLHFRPSNYDILMPDTALNMFMYGKNSLKTVLMSPRLIKIFKYHGIK